MEGRAGAPERLRGGVPPGAQVRAEAEAARAAPGDGAPGQEGAGHAGGGRIAGRLRGGDPPANVLASAPRSAPVGQQQAAGRCDRGAELPEDEDGEPGGGRSFPPDPNLGREDVCDFRGTMWRFSRIEKHFAEHRFKVPSLIE